MGLPILAVGPFGSGLFAGTENGSTAEEASVMQSVANIYLWIKVHAWTHSCQLAILQHWGWRCYPPVHPRSLLEAPTVGEGCWKWAESSTEDLLWRCWCCPLQVQRRLLRKGNSPLWRFTAGYDSTHFSQIYLSSEIDFPTHLLATEMMWERQRQSHPGSPMDLWPPGGRRPGSERSIADHWAAAPQESQTHPPGPWRKSGHTDNRKQQSESLHRVLTVLLFGVLFSIQWSDETR